MEISKRIKRKRTSSIYNNNTTATATATASCSTASPPESSPPPPPPPSLPLPLPHNIRNISETSMLHHHKKPSLLRTLDKTKVVAKKLDTLIAIASNINRHKKPIGPHWNTKLALAHVAAAFNQETASAQSFKAFQDHVQHINDKDNQIRFHYARQRNQQFLPPPTVVSDFPDSLTRTRNATLETPRPPEPALPTYEHLCARKKILDDTFGKPKTPKTRKWRKTLEPDKLAFVQKVLQQQGKISDLPGAYCEAHDIRKLRPRQWINDEIVTFYAVMINNRSIQFEKNPAAFPPHERFLKAHCFSSFFMAKYDKDGYDGVKRWSKKTDLLQKDVVIFPINIGNAHWTCAAINLRAERFEYFDSMGNKNPSVLANLRDYIVHEAWAKKQMKLDVSGWGEYQYEDIPQQNNSFDCGIFVCQFMDCLSRDWGAQSQPSHSATAHPPTRFDFSQEHMEYIRSKMIYEIATTHFLPEPWA